MRPQQQQREAEQGLARRIGQAGQFRAHPLLGSRTGIVLRGEVDHRQLPVRVGLYPLPWLVGRVRTEPRVQWLCLGHGLTQRRLEQHGFDRALELQAPADALRGSVRIQLQRQPHLALSAGERVPLYVRKD